MPAIHTLMKRLGFVKLSSYGLVLTPEGRILSLRPAVLDDGLGGRIVGWEDGDLAAMELEKWEPARPAAKPAVASRGAATPPPRSPQVTRPIPVVPQAVTPAPLAVSPERAMPITAPMIARPAPMLAAAPVVEEDDWEWTISLARARAAAEEAEQAAAAAPPAPPRRMRADTVPPPVVQPKFVAAKTQSMAVVADATLPDAKVDQDGWPKTEPLGEIDYNAYTNPMSEAVRVVRLAQTPRVKLPAKSTPAQAAPVVRAQPRPETAPSTVIPIPRLPSLQSTPRMTHVAPVVRSALPTPMMPAAPRRMAKGTGPVTSHPASVQQVPSEDTVPSLAMPPITNPVSLPSIRRATRG